MATARRQLGYVSSQSAQSVPTTATLSVDYLLVGGGGGAGRVGTKSGGGGAGGFVTATDLIGKGNTYTVTVGAGGAVSTDAEQPGRNGTASSFIRSANGGGGGSSFNQE